MSPTVCVHRAWIQVRTLPGSLLSFPDLSPLFSPEKENKQTDSQVLQSLRHFRLCHLLLPLISLICPSSDPHPSLKMGALPHCPSRHCHPHLIPGSVSTHREHCPLGSWTSSLPMVLSFTDFSYLLLDTFLGPVMTTNGSISEVLSLSLSPPPCHHHLLSFWLNSCVLTLEWCPLFQWDLQSF